MLDGPRRIAAREPTRPWHLYVAAGALGLVTYLIVYGPSHFIGTSSYWEMPTTDERAYLLGYRYFLAEPWHWPIFLSHTIDVPYAKSVAFQDCIPLWALINKAIATVIPPWRSFSAHAYLGIWHALVYALQTCFGVAVMRSLGHRSWRAGLVSALFFVAVPAFIFRYGHAALSAHWIELWALSLYLRRSVGRWSIAQLVVASLVNPYHAVMSLAVFVAAVARTRNWRSIATWLPIGALGVVAATWFAGYFAHDAAVAQWGYDKETTNVLSWLVPVRSGIVGDSRWIANTMATDWQYEGYAYLGLGVLGLGAIFLARVRVLPGVIRRHAVLFAVALGFWIIALSNHVYFGSHRILAYRIPSVLLWIPHQFRAPGRFVWIPMYVLIVFLLHHAFTRFATGRRFAVVVALLAIQLVDVRDEWALQRTWSAGPQHVVLDVAKWRPLVQAHAAVFVHPTYHCLGNGVSVLGEVSTEIEMLASERAIPINGTYTARPTRDCAAEERAWPTFAIEPGALYVLLPPATAIADRFPRCGTFDHGRVCSTNAAAIDAAIRDGILR